MYYELCNGQDCIIRCKLLWPSHLRWLYGPQVSQGGLARPRHAGRCMEEYLHGRMFSQFLHYLINTAALFSKVSNIISVWYCCIMQSVGQWNPCPLGSCQHFKQANRNTTYNTSLFLWLLSQLTKVFSVSVPHMVQTGCSSAQQWPAARCSRFSTNNTESNEITSASSAAENCPCPGLGLVLGAAACYLHPPAITHNQLPDCLAATAGSTAMQTVVISKWRRGQTLRCCVMGDMRNEDRLTFEERNDKKFLLTHSLDRFIVFLFWLIQIELSMWNNIKHLFLPASIISSSPCSLILAKE